MNIDICTYLKDIKSEVNDLDLNKHNEKVVKEILQLINCIQDCANRMENGLARRHTFMIKNKMELIYQAEKKEVKNRDDNYVNGRYVMPSKQKRSAW